MYPFSRSSADHGLRPCGPGRRRAAPARRRRGRAARRPDGPRRRPASRRRRHRLAAEVAGLPDIARERGLLELDRRIAEALRGVEGVAEVRARPRRRCAAQPLGQERGVLALLVADAARELEQLARRGRRTRRPGGRTPPGRARASGRSAGSPRRRPSTAPRRDAPSPPRRATVAPPAAAAPAHRSPARVTRPVTAQPSRPQVPDDPAALRAATRTAARTSVAPGPRAPSRPRRAGRRAAGPARCTRHFRAPGRPSGATWRSEWPSVMPRRRPGPWATALK